MKALHTVLAASVLAALPASAAPEPANPLQPLAFLAGHCYKGAVGKDEVDEHCFSWTVGGKALRDVHTVRGPAHPDYVGDTTYYWDSAAKRIEYLYVENDGGIMRGSVEAADGAIVFPDGKFVEGGQTLTLRVRWTLQGDDYEAWSEMQAKGAWTTMFKVKMVRSA